MILSSRVLCWNARQGFGKRPLHCWVSTRQRPSGVMSWVWNSQQLANSSVHPWRFVAMPEHASIRHAGGCACKQVRYHMIDRPLFVHCCHCSYCQRQSGSAFATNAMIETSAVKLLGGQLDAIEVSTPSGKGQVIYRCSGCKLAVWSTYGSAGELLRFVRVGTLDSPDCCPPDIHIYTLTKQPWITLSGDRPVMKEFYDRRTYWPAESQIRLKKLFEQ